MPNKPISDLSQLSTPASGDILPIVDVSDTTDSPDGTTKYIEVSDLVTGAPPAAHATEHENGGGDELDVTGLSGLLADPQTPATHTHTSSDISDFAEAVEDKIGTKVVAGTGISVSYNDTTGETEITNDDPGSGGGGTNPTNTVMPYNNAGALADSYLSHIIGSTQTQSAEHIALVNGKVLWFSASQDFGGLMASGTGAVKVVQNNTLDPGTILSNFNTSMPETPTHTIHPWSSEGMNFRHVLDGNTTIGNPGNHGGDGTAPSGYSFTLMLVQDGTGGHNYTWNAAFKFAGGVVPTQSTAANAVDIYQFIVFNDTAYCVGHFLDVK